MGTIIGINGSPRKKGNSAALLNAALQGAAANGQNTRLVHLCDLRFDDYSKFSSSMFDGQQKKRRHDAEFPGLLNQAYELGRNI